MIKYLTVLPSSLFLLALTMGVSSSAQADYNCESEYMEKSFECAENAVRTEKSRLTDIYNKHYRTLNNTQKQQMDNAQIAWLKQRDQACSYDEAPMNNMQVYLMIDANLCIAEKTKHRTQYYLSDFDASQLTNTSSTSSGFRRVTSDSTGNTTYYQGLTIVSGVLEVTHPDNDISPCGLCFTVNDADSHKIPRESGDDRMAWFAFNNTIYEPMANKYQLGNLVFDSQQCYKPIKATIEIKDYKADRRETETVDETTFVRFVSVDKPQPIECEVIPY